MSGRLVKSFDLADMASPGVTLLPKLQAAKARVRAGTGRGVVLCLGPSTTVGLGAGSGGAGKVGMLQKSWPAYLASILTAMGVPAEVNSFIGTHYAFADGVGIDSTLSAFGASWSQASFARPSIGGPPFRDGTTGQTALVSTHAIAFDSFRFLYGDNGSSASPDCVVKVDATTIDTVDMNTTSGVAAFRSKTYNPGNTAALASPATHTLSFSKASNVANEMVVIGADCWNSAAPKLSILNCGFNSGAVVDFARTTDGGGAAYGYHTAAAIVGLAADCVVLPGPTNDWWTGVTLAAFEDAYRLLLAACVTAGSDMICATCHPDARTDNTVAAGTGTLAEYNAIIRRLAYEYGAALIDHEARFVSRALRSAEYFDLVHLNAAGYADLADPIANLIRAA